MFSYDCNRKHYRRRSSRHVSSSFGLFSTGYRLESEIKMLILHPNFLTRILTLTSKHFQVDQSVLHILTGKKLRMQSMQCVNIWIYESRRFAVLRDPSRTQHVCCSHYDAEDACGLSASHLCVMSASHQSSDVCVCVCMYYTTPIYHLSRWISAEYTILNSTKGRSQLNHMTLSINPLISR